MEPFDYFASLDLVIKKKYDALRDFYYHKENAESVAEKYNYQPNVVASCIFQPLFVQLFW